MKHLISERHAFFKLVILLAAALFLMNVLVGCADYDRVDSGFEGWTMLSTPGHAISFDSKTLDLEAL